MCKEGEFNSLFIQERKIMIYDMQCMILLCIFAFENKNINTNNLNGGYIMARPIRETPTLYGDAARRFEERMKVKRHEDPEKKARRMKVYNALIKTLKT